MKQKEANTQEKIHCVRVQNHLTVRYRMKKVVEEKIKKAAKKEAEEKTPAKKPVKAKSAPELTTPKAKKADSKKPAKAKK